MKNKIVVWCGLMIAASLWFGYAVGFHNGVKEGQAKAQLQSGLSDRRQKSTHPGPLPTPVVSGHYIAGEVSWTRSLNYQAEPFPAPKPIKPPPLAQPQSPQ